VDSPEKKENVKKTFNTVAEGYGGPSMAFFQSSAAALPEILQLQGKEHVLDVATGTGLGACSLAAQLPHGRVTGIDFSSGMLEQANKNARAKGLDNIDWQMMDMQAITFDDAQFDVANCSFGIFFVDDMVSTLKHIASKVRPGGKITSCAFSMSSFEPNVDLFLNRIQTYGIELPSISWHRVGNQDLYRELYESAGLRDISVQEKNLSFTFDSADRWWDVIWYAGFRGLVSQLDEQQLQEFKRDHLAEIAALDKGNGVPMNITVNFALGYV